jgi:hypothetical protein
MDTSIIDEEIKTLELSISDDQKKIDLIKLNMDYHKRQLKNAISFKKELEAKKEVKNGN